MAGPWRQGSLIVDVVYGWSMETRFAHRGCSLWLVHGDKHKGLGQLLAHTEHVDTDTHIYGITFHSLFSAH